MAAFVWVKKSDKRRAKSALNRDVPNKVRDNRPRNKFCPQARGNLLSYHWPGAD